MSTELTSRVIVKNLPKWATEAQIKKHFGKKGQITDIKMMYTRSGVFRRFAYIGFASADEAATAVKYFDRTFIDTARVSVEVAYRAGSEELSRPWSKYSGGSSANDAHLREKERKTTEERRKKAVTTIDPLKAEMERKKKLLNSIYGIENDEESAKLRAFVNAVRPASKTKLWENDGEVLQGLEEKRKPMRPKTVQVNAVRNKKPGGQGQMVTKTHVKFEDDEEESAILDGEESDDLYEELTTIETDARSLDVDEKLSEETAIPEKPLEDKVKPASVDTLQIPADLITDTGRLFVRNLSYSCAEEDLKLLFQTFGPLTEVHLSISKETKKSKGFAYILFMFPEHALRAYTELDGTIFQGRILHILPAEEKPAAKQDQETTGSAYQDKKKRDQKASAQKDYNWNSLFIRSDTVLDAIAAKLGVTKSSIMDVTSENLATKLAVAETNLIHETKEYLESAGVVLDAFSEGFERSNTVILVKNLPFETEVQDIRKLFEKFGSVGRVVLPPTKAVAMVEFFESSEARAAFRTLAYSKFKHVPLFLEWAPVKALCLVKETGAPSVAAPKAIQDKEANPDDLSTLSLSSSTTLYVKNLNFSTTSDTLKTVFSAVGPVKSAKVATKKTGDKILSLGFGFVEFERKESLNRALDDLQNHVVDGHALLLKKSSSRADSSNVRQRKAPGATEGDNEENTKLVVRNIPFEASEKEVRELFKTFAQLKRVRLPRRFDGRHRGFGFVEFLTNQEAINARNTLAHTHLYGRHLVLEWAKPDNNDDEGEAVEELREKTRKRMNVGQQSTQQGKKLRIDGDGDEHEDEHEDEDEDE